MDWELLFVLASAFVACASLFLRWRIGRDRRMGSLRWLGGLVDELMALVATLEARVKDNGDEKQHLRAELAAAQARAAGLQEEKDRLRKSLGLRPDGLVFPPADDAAATTATTATTTTTTTTTTVTELPTPDDDGTPPPV